MNINDSANSHFILAFVISTIFILLELKYINMDKF